MAGEWLGVTLGDVLTLQRGFDLPENDRQTGRFPVIASTGKVGIHSEAKVKGPGVVIGRSGSLGGGQFIQEDFWPLNTTLWIKDFKGNDARFCYYLLKSIDLATFNAGSGVPTLNRNHIHPLPVQVPGDVAEQRAIAHILGTLDDKIELNRKMNETLEAMARALFKSWFVDFDPVRAKAEGRPTGLPKHIADLFPDSFEDSELGEIPKGWKQVRLGETLLLLKDGSHLPPKRVERGIRFIAGASNIKHFSIDFSKCTYITENDYNSIHKKWHLQEGDVLLTIVGTIGNVALVRSSDLPFSLQRSIAILRSGASISNTYLYYWLNTSEFRNILYSLVNPTGQPGIYLGTLSEILICLPPKEIINHFDKICNPGIAAMQSNIYQSNILIALRDTLLPKLISGELRVKDAEMFVGRNVF